ncbi:NuoI/complex I 23 kDa subunit family protein [Thermosulfuriphilus sp.]
MPEEYQQDGIIKVLDVPRRYRFPERIYLLEILKGMALTIAHFWENFRAALRGRGRPRYFTAKEGDPSYPWTWQYPEEKRFVHPRWRGLHIFKLDNKGMEACIACGMCEKVCPAKAIKIKAAKSGEEQGKRYSGPRYAATYEIDLLRCIFCGFCEEVCPKKAIELNQEYELAAYSRAETVYSKERLLANFERAKARGTVKVIPKAPPPKKPAPAKAGAKPGAKAAPAKGGQAQGAAPKEGAKTSPPQGQGTASQDKKE